MPQPGTPSAYEPERLPENIQVQVASQGNEKARIVEVLDDGTPCDGGRVALPTQPSGPLFSAASPSGIAATTVCFSCGAPHSLTRLPWPLPRCVAGYLVQLLDRMSNVKVAFTDVEVVRPVKKDKVPRRLLATPARRPIARHSRRRRVGGAAVRAQRAESRRVASRPRRR